MAAYQVSKHLRTIANIWEHWRGDLVDIRLMLDGDGMQAASLYEGAEALAKAMQDYALPGSVDLDEVIYKTADGQYAHPTLNLMAELHADHGSEEFWYPVGDFCERYGLTERTLLLENDDSPIGDACKSLLEQGLCDDTQVAHVWHPQRQPGEMLILKQIGEDGLYAVFVQRKSYEPVPCKDCGRADGEWCEKVDCPNALF